MLVYDIIILYRRTPGDLSEILIMIICENRRDQTTFSSNSLFSAEELDGIELNGGDDDFGEENL